MREDPAVDSARARIEPRQIAGIRQRTVNLADEIDMERSFTCCSFASKPGKQLKDILRRHHRFCCFIENVQLVELLNFKINNISVDKGKVAAENNMFWASEI